MSLSADALFPKGLLRPERLFGRHCAILGATGGGKSWTTARMIEECIRYKAKLILLDATGEYRGFSGAAVEHCHLGAPVTRASTSTACALPPTSFLESDFVALFAPAGKIQGPKMRAAIRSLRLATLKPTLAPEGFIRKIDQQKKPINDAEKEAVISSKLDDPRQPFDATCLVAQIEQECVYPDGFGSVRGQKDVTRWGGEDGNFAHCLSLVARINGVLASPAFKCVFASTDPHVTQRIEDFIASDRRLLRICLSGIAYEFNAREIIANVIGRYLLTKARNGSFQNQPVVVIVDEAHNFLGRQIGAEDYAARLDAFELIAKEGRKYGLNVCLATQRPRDITEGVLSQMGTLIVHRLTNDRDREVVERACGEIDRSASAFLPNLKPGEAVGRFLYRVLHGAPFRRAGDVIAPNEWLLRKIPFNAQYYDPQLEISIQRVAFAPNKEDTDGLSFFREHMTKVEKLTLTASATSLLVSIGAAVLTPFATYWWFDPAQQRVAGKRTATAC